MNKCVNMLEHISASIIPCQSHIPSHIRIPWGNQMFPNVMMALHSAYVFTQGQLHVQPKS